LDQPYAKAVQADPQVQRQVERRAQEIMEKDHADELRLADAAHRIKGALSRSYQQARRAGLTKSRRPEDFLTEGDLSKLEKTIKSQRAEAKEAVRRSQKNEAAAGSTA